MADIGLVDFYAHEYGTDWKELDPGFLKDRANADVPAFPLEVVAEPWRAWIAQAAHGAGAPVDYVAHALLGAVAGLCGGGRVEVTPAWHEPLRLWQALVGGASAGRSPALAPVRRLLAAIEGESERQGEGAGGAARLVVEQPPAPAGVEADGGLLWCDDAAWLPVLARRPAWLKADSPGRSSDRPPSLVGCLDAETLAESLEQAGRGLVARLLFAWPAPTPPRPLSEVTVGPERAAEWLRRLAAETGAHPGTGAPGGVALRVDRGGLAALDGVLARLHAQAVAAEGTEAAWLGKGRGSVVRLAGVLELLAWSCAESAGRPGDLGGERIEAAWALWQDYYRPQAAAVLSGSASRGLEERARRVARWLRLTGAVEVSREEVRCQALGWRVSADGADSVLAHLARAGLLRFRRGYSGPHGGRPIHRWEVNPALATL